MRIRDIIIKEEVENPGYTGDSLDLWNVLSDEQKRWVVGSKGKGMPNLMDPFIQKRIPGQTFHDNIAMQKISRAGGMPRNTPEQRKARDELIASLAYKVPKTQGEIDARNAGLAQGSLDPVDNIERAREALGQRAVELEKQLKLNPDNQDLLNQVGDIVNQELALDQRYQDWAVSNYDRNRDLEPGERRRTTDKVTTKSSTGDLSFRPEVWKTTTTTIDNLPKDDDPKTNNQNNDPDKEIRKVLEPTSSNSSSSNQTIKPTSAVNKYFNPMTSIAETLKKLDELNQETVKEEDRPTKQPPEKEDNIIKTFADIVTLRQKGIDPKEVISNASRIGQDPSSENVLAGQANAVKKVAKSIKSLFNRDND